MEPADLGFEEAVQRCMRAVGAQGEGDGAQGEGREDKAALLGGMALEQEDGAGSDDEGGDAMAMGKLGGKAALLGGAGGKAALLGGMALEQEEGAGSDDEGGDDTAMGKLGGKAALLGGAGGKAPLSPAAPSTVPEACAALLRIADKADSGTVPPSLVHAMGRAVHGDFWDEEMVEVVREDGMLDAADFIEYAQVGAWHGLLWAWPYPDSVPGRCCSWSRQI